MMHGTVSEINGYVSYRIVHSIQFTFILDAAKLVLEKAYSSDNDSVIVLYTVVFLLSQVLFGIHYYTMCDNDSIFAWPSPGKEQNNYSRTRRSSHL